MDGWMNEWMNLKVMISSYALTLGFLIATPLPRAMFTVVFL
jgi:hypothetical protein